jgi:hypothetical protein
MAFWSQGGSEVVSAETLFPAKSLDPLFTPAPRMTKTRGHSGTKTTAINNFVLYIDPGY